MAGTFIVGAEDVILVPDDDSYAASRPIQEGLDMVALLSKAYGRFVVLTKCPEEEKVEFWCKANGLKGADVKSFNPEMRTEPEELAQWRMIQTVRSKGPVWLVITAFPQVFDYCLGAFQPVVLFGRRGALGALAPSPSWQTVVERVGKTREARVNAEGNDQEWEGAAAP